MTQISTHNGYTNRETWLVSLWLSNEPYTYEVLTEMVKNMQGRIFNSAELYEKSDELKQFVYTLCMGENSEINGTGSSLVCDLVTNALSSVNYREIISGALEFPCIE